MSQVMRLHPDQRRAADPNASVWVTASAGTGKTRVLASRIARLLLTGCKPHRILALTFTNAAAAEMADRVSQTLAEWAVMDERDLSETLNNLTGEVTTKKSMDAARRCFAAVLDDPIGLRAHTIHGFCQSLLRRFPVEADVPPHFMLIDERTEAELLQQAGDTVIRRNLGPDGFGKDAAEALADVMDLDKALDIARDLMKDRARLKDLPGRRGDFDKAYADLLEIDVLDTEEAIIKVACDEVQFDLKNLTSAADLMASSSTNYVDRGQAFLTWLSSDLEERQVGYLAYEKEFFTKKGEPIKESSFLPKPLREERPEALEALLREQARITRVRERANRAALLRVNTALGLFVTALADEYERLKRLRACLDYDDLIFEATKLLTRADARAWVLFKLDGGLDHILVDEAQDNSQAQWRIFRAIAEELVAGKGAAEEKSELAGRSLFVVGDPKQSIYRFQGADPGAFSDTRAWVEGQLGELEAAGQFDQVDLSTSFRSAEPILSFVDQVLADPAMPEGAFSDHAPHRAFEPSTKPGLVEIWPLMREAQKRKIEPWPLPSGYDSSERTVERLAKALAEKIQALVETDAHPVNPQDILVLVRKRPRFVPALITALKTLQVPVEGADRLSLTEELAVQDLLVLADFLLQRDDELALATVLRGPLINLGEDELFELAYGRGETGLWQRLVERAAADDRIGAIHVYLTDLLADVDFIGPHALFSRVLSMPCPADEISGRRGLATRLGRPINDPLDELLSQALSFETAHPPTLQGFLHWVRLTEAPLKRASGETFAGIRVMTIHGAKGLEADTVFLVDVDGQAPQKSKLFWYPTPDGALPLWSPAKDLSCDLIRDRQKDWRAAEKAEQMRLLYVALTRARRRLFICGSGPAEEKNDKQDRWYHFCERAMAKMQPIQERPFDSALDHAWSGTASRYALRTELFSADKPEVNVVEPIAPDHWSRRSVVAETAANSVRPSQWGELDEEPASIPPLPSDGTGRFRRGLLIHALLERLPALQADQRVQAGMAYLSQPINGLKDEQVETYLAEALRVIEDPDFSAIFSDQALVEAPIIGQVGNITVNGQIDRLVVGPNAVLIVDFKTNRPPPQKVEAVSSLYLRQMAGYRAVMQQIYPDRAVRCALIWTAEARIMPLPVNLLDDVLRN